LKPYDAKQPIFMQQFGNRTAQLPNGEIVPVRVFYNLDDNGKHPITGEDVDPQFIFPGQVIVKGVPDTIVEASRLQYGFSPGLGGYVVLDKGEFPGVNSITEKAPGELPNIQDVLKVITNWYNETPHHKQGISYQIAKDASMADIDSHIVLSRTLETGCSVVLFVRYPFPVDGIPHRPEVLLARLNTTELNDTYVPYLEAAFDVMANSSETDAGYGLLGVYRELRIVKQDEKHLIQLVRTVTATHSEKPHRTRLEHVTLLATRTTDGDLITNNSILSSEYSTYSLGEQLEPLLKKKVTD